MGTSDDVSCVPSCAFDMQIWWSRMICPPAAPVSPPPPLMFGWGLLDLTEPGGVVHEWPYSSVVKVGAHLLFTGFSAGPTVGEASWVALPPFSTCAVWDWDHALVVGRLY